jgi:plastocyanin
MRFRSLIGAGVLVAGAVGIVPAQTPSDVTVQLFQYRPGVREVKAGTRVVWTNEDDIEHTATSGTPEKRDGRFDVRLTGKGTKDGVEFGRTGVYPYFCDRHRSMRGEIRVN